MKKKTTAKKRTVKKLPVKKRLVPKFLVKDKKALLDQLVTYEEERRKIDDAQNKLWRRMDNLNKKRQNTVDLLCDGIRSNKEDEEDPILYKNKSFQLERNGGYDEKWYITIKPMRKI